MILSFFMAICLPVESADARRRPKATGDNNKYAAFVMDAASGQVLYQSNADKPLHPASLTKIMTLLMVFEALNNGKLSLRDRVVISRHAATMPPSKLGLKPGSSIRVQDAIYAVVTKSANDISAALAEKVGGSESRFASLMNARAAELGMTQTHFVNASGLHHPRQKSSARDMAKLARFVINTYPDYYRYFSKKNFSYAGYNYHNHNRLMETYKGMDGMKTGYTNPSGFNLVASAVRGNRRVIGVVFGGRSAQSRNTHMASLLDQGFAKLKNQPEILVARADTPPAVPKPGQKPQRDSNPVLSPPVSYAQNGTLESSETTESLQIAAFAPTGLQQTEKQISVQSDSIRPKVIRVNIPADAAADNTMPVPQQKPAMLMAAAKLNNLKPAMGMIKNAALPTGLLTAPQNAIEPPSNPQTRNDSSLLASTFPSWAIQVGAYTSRAATDQAIHNSMKKLPVKYASLSPIIAPMKTQDGWLFRARLHGLSRNDALKACSYLKDCVPIAPKTN